MHVKPVPGRQVPDPDKGGYLSADGREVEDSVYWHRRVTDGDVRISTEVAKLPAADKKGQK